MAQGDGLAQRREIDAVMVTEQSQRGSETEVGAAQLRLRLWTWLRVR